MADATRLQSALAERYIIERELGSGGLATVYLARDIKHDREVALKVLRPDLSAVIGTERFLSEVRITAKLDHPHILTLIDSGEADGLLYYVLPYVRGESLRHKLEREKQLSVDDAVSIVKQVASALDYAHEHGVVHRDIKPENILLHEGEAVLTDFGIALAVKEAGGRRLTETGLSLGTPQYMSPEQATGDRALDKRSDIYSLGAVFYEMITGEPPVTGATAQAMIAKLLTEKPVKMRVVRQTVPLEMEIATDKALSKVPADRYASAGEFARALTNGVVRDELKPGSSGLKWAGVAALIIAVIGVSFFAKSPKTKSVSYREAALGNRTQLTSTGGIQMPTISADGKALAYVVTECSSNGCRYGIDLKDVETGISRRLFDGASGINRVDISPDRRNLIVGGTFRGKFGSFIVSTVGGMPRYVNYFVNFYAGGDSLVMSRDGSAGESFWMLLSGLDGNPVDSVQVNEPGDHPPYFENVPGSSRFMARGASHGAMQITALDRSGKILSSFKLPRGVVTGSRISKDALWLYMNPRSGHSPIVRVPFDPVTMKFAQKGDTVYTGGETMMSVTADGSAIAFDEGVSEYTTWILPVNDMVNNRFADTNRVLQGTNGVNGAMSPDGKLSIIGRADGISAVVAGTVTEMTIPGQHFSIEPIDSVTLQIADVASDGMTLYLYDIRSHSRIAERKISDQALFGFDFARLVDSWAWLSRRTTIRMQRDNEASPREIKPPWGISSLFDLSVSPDARQLAITGFLEGDDSVAVGTFSVADNRFSLVYKNVAEGCTATFLDNGDLALAVNDTPESVTIYRVTPGESVRRIGSTPRPIPRNTTVNVTRDLKRAFVITREDKRDVWMAKVVR